MPKNKFQIYSFTMLLVALTAIVANAGGPLFMFDPENRIPYRYDVSSPVRVYTDLGPFKVAVAGNPLTISNERADEVTAFAFQQWTNVPSSSFQASVVGDFSALGLPDIVAANAGSVIGPDNGGGIHVIYDADGSLLQNFFGVSPSVLGIASPEWADESTGILTESWAVMNGRAVAAADTNANVFSGVFTHEFGHSINLAHSQTNGGIAFQSEPRGPAGCAALPYHTNLTISDIETMYPFLSVAATGGSGAAQATVDRTDDLAAVSDIYPAPDYQATKGAISGRILANDRRTPIDGVNVIARNLDAPYADATSAMSGDYTRGVTGADGRFTLSGLTPGARYAVYADVIRAGGFPTAPIVFLPGPEEFFSGSAESNDALTDAPCEAEAVTIAPGQTVEAEIVLNRVKGAPVMTFMATNAAPSSLTTDGSTAGGYFLPGSAAFRWNAEAGVEILGATSTNGEISRDGLAYAGDYAAPDGMRAPSILTADKTWQQLPVPAGAAPCDAIGATYGVANQGSAVTGFYYFPGCRAVPFLWTPTGGTQILPTPPGTRDARGNSLSADGSTVPGWFTASGNGLTRAGMRWVNGQYYDFSQEAGIPVGEAYKATPDGSVIVGQNAGVNREGWRWTSSGGLEIIGGLPKNTPLETSGALTVNDDGRVVLGTTGRAGVSRPWLWMRELGGVVNLDEFLLAQGTYLGASVTLNAPFDISGDGTKFVGLSLAPTPAGRFGYHVDMSKVIVCHAPPGNPANAKSVSVGFPDDMLSHFGHGDTVGLCSDAE